MMKIQIGSLSEGTHEYQFEAVPSDIALGDGFASPVTVHATLEKTGRQLFLQARIHTTGSFACDRCTAEFGLPMSPAYRMFYVPDETDAAAFDPSEVQVVPSGLPVIDLAEDVRQTILLAVPLKLLCRPDCRGLCSRCGADLNAGPCACPADVTDARWDGLRRIQQEEN